MESHQEREDEEIDKDEDYDKESVEQMNRAISKSFKIEQPEVKRDFDGEGNEKVPISAKI